MAAEGLTADLWVPDSNLTVLLGEMPHAPLPSPLALLSHSGDVLDWHVGSITVRSRARSVSLYRS